MSVSVAPSRSSVMGRREAICELLESGGRLGVEELARRFGVSTVTIRRDLRLLETAGRLIRTRGGAASMRGRDFSFAEKLAQARPQKEAIGRAAAGLVKPGESVILDSGSTAYLAARFLRAASGVTVVTNSLPAVIELFGADGVEVLVLGGVLDRGSAEFVGPAMRAGLAGVRARTALLGADGLTAARGAQAAGARGAESARVLAEHAEEVVVLADAKKLGRDSFAAYLEARRIGRVVTAGELDERARRECRLLRDMGVEIVRADVPERAEHEGAGALRRKEQ